jgi:hypothetical protein
MGDKARLYYAQSYTIDEDSELHMYSVNDWIMSFRALINDDVKAINLSMGWNGVLPYAASRGNANAINAIKAESAPISNALKRLILSGKEFIICVSAGNSNNKHYFKDDSQPYGYRTSAERTLWESFWGLDGESGDVEAQYNSSLAYIGDDAVKSRIVVIGSVKNENVDGAKSESRFQYSDFSNIGARVDIVAPGERIYSTVVNGYENRYWAENDQSWHDWSGTSMASPHVTGAAGLIFAANPDLTGADVKKILLASTYGRFYYTGGYAGMVNAETAVVNALKTRDHSVNRVIKSDMDDGLDLCFVVDTTASMYDDIDNAKQNMSNILASLFSKSENARVAIAGYQDFKERNPDIPEIEPSSLYLDFVSDKQTIQSAVDEITILETGNCDWPEAVFSGLIEAVGLNWRPFAQKVIIIMGDAEALDPEPNTGYTFNSVLAALYDADIAIDIESSDDRVLGDAGDSLIKVYSIGTSAGVEAADFFERISTETGGGYTDVNSANEVSDAIVSSIEQIEITPTKTVNVEFGADYSGETVEIYQGREFFFETRLDEYGRVRLESMEFDRYDWKIPRLMAAGTIKISESGKTARVAFDDAPWYQFAVNLWQRERAITIVCGTGAALLLVLVWVCVNRIRKWGKKRRQARLEQVDKVVRSAKVIEGITEPATMEAVPKTVAMVDPVYTAVMTEQTTAAGAQPITPEFTSVIAAPTRLRPSSAEPIIKPREYICPNCGAKYEKPVNFCGRCGVKM